jgi:hypothetical protein
LTFERPAARKALSIFRSETARSRTSRHRYPYQFEVAFEED